jgi:hypothetical protein
MNKIIPVVVLVVIAGGLIWVFQNRSRVRPNPEIVEFNKDADRLIQGLQQYKEFFKKYPTGTSAEISKALSGQGEGKVIIYATDGANKNDKGEIVDRWGTPIQFYFSHNAVLIRSAGPNRIWEDSRYNGSDDMYRTDTK